VCSNPTRTVNVLPATVLSAGLGPTAYQLPHCSRRDSHAEVNSNPSQDYGRLRAGSSEEVWPASNYQVAAWNYLQVDSLVKLVVHHDYNVYTFMAELNLLLAGIINVSYNVATNTYTYKNLTLVGYSINPSNCSKLLGLIKKTDISAMSNITSGFVNMVDYQQVILRCPTLVFENNSMDNIQDQDDFISVSDILYWINKQDVEPFKMINYKNEDCSTLYSYNIINRNINRLNFKLGNEYNEPIYDAPDYLLQLQISVYEKDANFFKEATIQALKLLNDIYFTLLNIINLMIKK
jgi:hypothetical protein